jgi:hypothetical protein
VNDLDILFPKGKDVQVGDSVITVLPFTFGMLPKIAEHVAPILRILVSAGFAEISTKGEGDDVMQTLTLSPTWMFNFLDIMAGSGERVLDFLAVALKIDRDFVDKLTPEEGISLIKAVIEVNADYFSKKVLPILKKKDPIAPEKVVSGSEQ